VIVPAYLRENHSEVLEWGFDLPKPIPDLKIDADGLSGTLSFGPGLRMFCFVPWSAVFALSSPVLDRGMTWLSDAPIEVQREILANAGRRANTKVKTDRNQARQMKGHLRLVKNNKGAA
jgi:hypothetical protein